MIKFPDDAILHDKLSSLFDDGKRSPQQLKLISRRASAHASTFPAEIVSCKLNDGAPFNLLCKYLDGGGPNHFGHRGAVEYEARVYREVLRDIPLPIVKFYGICHLRGKGEVFIVLEYLDGSVRMKLKIQKPPYISTLRKAASWIAGFHKHFESASASFVTKYDAAYYKIWSEMVEKIAKVLKPRYRFLPNLCRYFDDNISILTSSPQTIIHGEYTPGNLLMKDGLIYPIDWESAAIAPGEIDLACMLDGWGKKTAEKVAAFYRKNRWSDDGQLNNEFEKRFLLAQIYIQFRWIGDDDLQNWKENPWRFIVLRQLAKKAGWKNA